MKIDEIIEKNIEKLKMPEWECSVTQLPIFTGTPRPTQYIDISYNTKTGEIGKNKADSHIVVEDTKKGYFLSELHEFHGSKESLGYQVLKKSIEAFNETYRRKTK